MLNNNNTLTMPTHEDQVTDPLYWNWVKGGLGLKYLTEGLKSFVEDTLKTVQTGFLDDIRKNRPGLQEVKCTECTTANVLSCPTTGMCNIRKRGKLSICTYHDKTNKLKISRPCPNSICDKIPLKICSLHRYEDPSWKNTNAQNWCSNHFEIGKCFLPKSGYEDKTSISDTDSSGILNMAINCLSIQTRLHFYINPPNDILSKLVKTRNSIFHSVSCTLTKKQLDSYIDDMVTLLEDKKSLLADPRAQTAVLKLTQLKNGQFNISPKNELDIRNEALQAVEEKKKEAIQDIQDKQEEVIDSIKETHAVKRSQMSEEFTAHTKTMASQCDALRSSIQTLKSTQETLEGNIENHEHRLKAIEQTLTKLETSQERTEEKFTILLKDFLDFKDDIKATNTVEYNHKERIEYLKRKQKLQTKLCEMYKRHVESIPLSPVLDGLDAKVDDMFVELVICDDKTHEPRSTDKLYKYNTQYSDKNIKGYRDIFFRKVYACKNKEKHKCDRYCEIKEQECKCKNMYIIGDAGMGKTTWCMKMISKWVDALMTDDKITDGRGKFNNETIMSKIDLLFFISLRHAVNKGAIQDMIRDQLFEEFPEMDSIAKDVLKTEPQNCLIILDGLDEWQPSIDFKTPSSLHHPGLPGRQNVHGCPILTTTRPWKLDAVRLSNTDIDRAVIIQGLKDQDSLIETIIFHLKDKGVHEDILDKKGKLDFILAFKKAFNTSLVSFNSSDDDYRIHNTDTDSDTDSDSDTYYNEVDYSCNNYYEWKNEYTSNISFHKVPIVLVFMVCLWYDEGKLETTWAANFTGLIDFLIRIAESNIYNRRPGRLSVKDNLPELKAKWSMSSRYLPDSFRKIKRLTNYSELILKLSKLAFRSLFNDCKESTLVFTEESLENEFSTDELDVALKIGLLSQSKVVGKTLKRLTSLSFFHKSIQELCASLFLVWKTENDDKTALNQFSHYCKTTKDIKEMENVLMFVCGLSPSTASEMSKHVADVTQYDRDNLLDLKTKCVLEMQAAHGSSFPSKECPIFTYDTSLDEHQNNCTHLKLVETNTDYLVSLHLTRTQVPVYLPEMIQLQELTLENVNGLVQQNNVLDLSQLIELQSIHLYELNCKCIVRLDGWKLQNILFVKCCSIEIETLSKCQLAKETMIKENSETGCKMKDISLIQCTDCKMSIKGEICTIDNVCFESCISCQFTIQACEEIQGTGNTSTGQRLNIHRFVIHSSINLTLDINKAVEVTGVQIKDYKCPLKGNASIDNLIQQLPTFKQIDIEHWRFVDCSHFMLPNDVEDITITIEWIETVRYLSNIVHLRLYKYMSDTFRLREPKPNNLTEILPNLTKLKSFEIDDTVTTTVLDILTKSCIERLGLRVCDGFEELSQYLLRIQNLQYLKLTDIRFSNFQHLRRMLLHMPQLKTLSISLIRNTVGINERNADHEQHSDKNVKELQLEEFSIDLGVCLFGVNLPKSIVSYLKYCCHLKDLSCQNYVLKQLLSEPELKLILTQVETFKSKDETKRNISLIHLKQPSEGIEDVSLKFINKLYNVRRVNFRHTFDKDRVEVSFEAINKLCNVRHVDLRHIIFDDFEKVCGVFVNLHYLETLNLECIGSNSSNILISRQFMDSLPVTRQPITIEISRCRLDYDVEQYLRSRKWLQSVERTFHHKLDIDETNDRYYRLKIVLWKKDV